MTLAAAVIAPHPPILIPQVGGEYLETISATAAALRDAAKTLDDNGVEALIIISPHSPLFRDRFIIRGEERLQADFTQFGAAHPKFVVENDLKAVEAMVVSCRKAGVGLDAWVSPQGPWLDWGVSVPYSYLGAARPIVSLSISIATYAAHYALGQGLAAAVAWSKTRFALVASGDLSHRLTEDAPNGYSPRGVEFDRLVTQIVKEGRFDDLMNIDADLIDAAGECGLRSFITMAGAFSEAKVEPKVLSYEGPFGVGYLVATISVKDGQDNVRPD